VKVPTVSIGLPVYNGADFLQVALDSLLAQDYRDFELIISDNASVDATSEICSKVASDSRVRLFRNDANIGASENFNRVFRLARGKYFMWAAHDDRWDASYLDRCIDTLERNASVVICATDVRFIDENGAELDEETYRLLIEDHNRLHTISMGLVERGRELSRTINWYTLYGVIRTETLRKTRIVRNRYAADVLLLMELLFHGETMTLPEKLFDYRIIKKTAERQMEAISGAASKEKLRPYTLTAQGLLDVIAESQFSSAVKRELRDDLLENVSFANRLWADRIVDEHRPAISDSNRLIASFQICDLLNGAPIRPPESLYDAAYEKSLRGLPMSERLQTMVRHMLAKHVMWRFRTKA
jgi:glycosyltransferase involved in cell wall biosynthesis